MASDGTLASSSSLFSKIRANTFKALETFVDEVDDWLVLVDIVCVQFWLYCLSKRLNDYMIDQSSGYILVIMRVIYHLCMI